MNTSTPETDSARMASDSPPMDDTTTGAPPGAAAAPPGAEAAPPGAAATGLAGRTPGADATGLATSDAAPLRDFQRAYLLQQVMDAPEHQLAKGKANRFPRAVARELGLSPTLANEMRDDLVQEGHLNTLKKAGSIVYELTERGRQLLGTLPQKTVPEGREPVREASVSQEVQLARKTFLLFQLFESPHQTMDQKQANRFREPGRKFLDLRATTANRIRKEMADQGLIDMTRDGRNATYKLTQRGIDFLGASGSFPETEFTMHGQVLNLLLEAAREAAKQFDQAETTEPEPEPATVG